MLKKVWNHKEHNALILQLVVIVVEFNVQFQIQSFTAKLPISNLL